MSDTLFDDVDDAPLGQRDSVWKECPLDTFMRMSEREQLDYCARRDEDSARFADDEDDMKFFLQRASWYRRSIERIDNPPVTGIREHVCGLSGIGFQCPACEAKENQGR